MPCSFSPLLINIHRHAGLEFNSEFVLVYGDLFNQSSDKLLIIFDESGGLLLYECAHISHALFQKTYTVDILEKKREANKGQVPKYYVENSHESIIPKDIFLKVQEEITRRANLTKGSTERRRVYSGRYALSGMVFCVHCGDIFRRIKWNNRGCKSTVWRCTSRVDKDGPDCPARTVREELLHEVVVKAINEAFRGKKNILPILQDNIESSLTEDVDDRIAVVDEQIKSLQHELLATAE